MHEEDSRPGNPAPQIIHSAAFRCDPRPSAPPPSSEKGTTPVFESRPGGCDMVPPRPPANELKDAVIVEAQRTAPPPEAGNGTADGERPASLGLLRLLGWGCGLLAVFWMFSLSAPFLANALALHGWRLAAALFLGGLPPAMAVAILGYALWRFRRIPAVAQVREADFRDAKDLRAALQLRYLAGLPAAETYAERNGFSDGEGRKNRTLLVACLDRLQGIVPGHYADATGWLDDFRQFQSFQDARARGIINRTALLVGVKTAASPWAIVDMLAVLYHSTLMIAALARLYNRQTSPREAFRLACRWLVNLYIAGNLGDAAERTAEWAAASDLVSTAWGPLATVAGKMAEGGGNAFLVFRLGRRAMEAFRPLVPAPRSRNL